MRKKVALEVEVLVRLSEQELRWVQLELETNRKPSASAVRKFFEKCIDDELVRLSEEHPEGDTDD